MTAAPGVAVPSSVAVLAPFAAAGIIEAADVQFAATMARLVPGLTDPVVLALALAMRAPRYGHVCLSLDELVALHGDQDAGEAEEVPWPEVGTWMDDLIGSEMVSFPADAGRGPLRPLVFDDGRIYLQRFWAYEVAVAADIARRASTGDGMAGTVGALSRDALDLLFPPGPGPEPGPDSEDLQRLAVRRGMEPGVSIIAGGPGTGKTHTLARLLVASHLAARAGGGELRIALAAPTGKAASRMADAVRAEVDVLRDSGVIDASVGEALEVEGASTIHSLLGWRGRTRFAHDRQRPLPHDLVIVDETSMVSLPLMAKLLDAVRPEARLVLVGDPYQLASIEAGTVLSDLVGSVDGDRVGGDSGGDSGGESDSDGADADADAGDGAQVSALAGRVTVLRTMHRFSEGSTIAALGEAVRTGDADRALDLARGGRGDVRWVRADDRDGLAGVLEEVVAVGIEMVTAALDGDPVGSLGAATRTKVLAATRRGPRRRDAWTERKEGEVAARVAAFTPNRRWHPGRPVLVTANDPGNRVFNGDSGVVVRGGAGLEVALSTGEGLRLLAPSRIERAETWWAMTIHKSQGSEFSDVVVSLPRSGSPILTRELLYTAVTRARDRLTIVASEEALRSAIGRPVARASGLRRRLGGGS